MGRPLHDTVLKTASCSELGGLVFNNVGGLTAAQIARLVIGDRGACGDPNPGRVWVPTLQIETFRRLARVAKRLVF
eukprot:COSAG03_NODE_12427_length_548_cov_0.935412_1_plen_75_part_10